MGRLIIKHSSTPGAVPEPEVLATGELAVNTADARVFTKHSDGSVKELGAGDAADGVTKENFIDRVLDDGSLLNTVSAAYVKNGVGAAYVLFQGVASFLATSIGGATFIGRGKVELSGGVSISDWGKVIIAAPASATGAAAIRVSGDHQRTLATDTRFTVGNWYGNTRDVGGYVKVRLSVASTPSARHTAVVTLGGTGPESAGTNLPNAGHTGVMLTCVDDENSGNWVIKYRNTSGSLAAVNTSKAPAIGGVNNTQAGNEMVLKMRKTAIGNAAITVTVDGTDYTISDHAVAANSNNFIHMAVGFKVVKQSGAAAVNMYAETPVIAATAP